MQFIASQGTVSAMCARYQIPTQAEAEAYWRLLHSRWSFAPRWRVLPTEQVPVVLNTSAGIAGWMMRWDLVPYRNHGEPTGKSLINAQAENLAAVHYWRAPWSRGQRCIFTMAGFYEPHRYADGRKEPFYVRLTDREVFGVAGIWERSVKGDGTEVHSCALITVPPNALLAGIHNEKPRMPAVLREEHHDAWLTGTPEQARAVLLPYPGERMTAWQVTRRVNSPRLPDDASLIAPAVQSGPRA
jgi:putative SOS response-associated peptidase YedK